MSDFSQAFPNSSKIHVEGPQQVSVPMREIALTGGEPPLRVYDTSGPYTDPNARIDIQAGLPNLRREWIEARGDVESYDARHIRPSSQRLRDLPAALH